MTTWGGTQYAWASLPIFALGIIGVVMLAGFVVVERRVTEPILPFRLFRIQVFNVASGVGFVIGFAMFGAITFLPVFLQLVDGASATSSGLNILPADGRPAGRIDLQRSDHQPSRRYKIFPVIGTALAAIGVFLLSTIDPQTPRFVLSIYMVVLGLGLGCVMQVLVIAVQNAVEQRDLGVGTSSATFLRSMGASFGVAIFGAIFSNQLAANLKKNLPASALHSGINPASLEGNPAQLAHLPPAIHTGLINAVSESPPCRLSHRGADPGGRLLPDPADQGGPASHQGSWDSRRRRAIGAGRRDRPRRRCAGRGRGRVRAGTLDGAEREPRGTRLPRMTSERRRRIVIAAGLGLLATITATRVLALRRELSQDTR